MRSVNTKNMKVCGPNKWHSRRNSLQENVEMKIYGCGSFTAVSASSVPMNLPYGPFTNCMVEMIHISLIDLLMCLKD